MTEPRESSQQNYRGGLTWLHVLAISLLMSCASFGIGFLLGGIGGSLQIYRNRYREVLSVINPVIENEPAFADLEIKEASNGGVWLFGLVENKEEMTRVKTVLANALGAHEAEKIMWGVSVKK